MTSNAYHRREFITRAVAAGEGAGLTLTARSWAADASAQKPAQPSTPNAEKLGWQLCCGLYTFRDRSFYEALPVISGMGMRLVEPCFFLPLSKGRRS